MTPQAPRSLDRSLTSGIAWTGIVGTVVQVLRWGSTLVIARILSPEDYGLVGMATVFTGLIQMVSEFGLGGAIVQRGDRLDRDKIARLGGAAIILGLLLTALSFGAAPLVVLFFKEPAVLPIVMVLGVNFTMDATRMVPRSLLRRDLEFRRLALLEGAEGVVLALVTLTLAIVGLGHWALVLGTSAASLAATILTNAWRPHPIAFPRSPGTIKDELFFGLHLTGSRIGWYIYSNADFAIVGRRFGDAKLGDYTIAWALASMPVERIAAIVGRVTPSVFAAVQDSPKELRRYLCGVSEGISLLAFPMAIGLSLIASDLVPVVLGARWSGAILPLQALAVAAAVRALGPPLSQTLVAIGRPDLEARYTYVGVVYFITVFLIGSQWGVFGVAMGWVIGYPILLSSYLLRQVMRLAGLKWREYLGALWGAASSSFIMVLAVVGVRTLTTDVLSPAPRMGVSVLVGAVAYAGALLLFHRSRATRFLQLLKRPRG